jgi:hypothetical protein
VTADRNPIARLAAVLRARRIPDPEQVALLATEHIAHQLHQRDGHSESAEWLIAAGELYAQRLLDP